MTDLKEFRRFEQRPFVGDFWEHVSSSEEGPLHKTLEFFEISHGSYKPFNFLPYLSLSTQYSILISFTNTSTLNQIQTHWVVLMSVMQWLTVSSVPRRQLICRPGRPNKCTEGLSCSPENFFKNETYGINCSWESPLDSVTTVSELSGAYQGNNIALKAILNFG